MDVEGQLVQFAFFLFAFPRVKWSEGGHWNAM